MPPAPMPPLVPPPRPHCALPSDCFSHATASTRSCDRASTRSAATMAVEPPTLTGGVHAEHRLAVGAERVGEVQLGLHHAFERCRAPCRSRPRRCRPTSARRRRARGSRPRARGRRSTRRRGAFVCLVWPMPTTRRAGRPCSRSPSRTQTRFCCRHGRRSRARAPRSRPCSMIWRAASTMRTRPVAMTGLAASGPPDGFTSTSVAEAERLAQDQLLGRERAPTARRPRPGPSPTPAPSRRQRGRRRRR